jgi:ferric enterobactin receptor
MKQLLRLTKARINNFIPPKAILNIVQFALFFCSLTAICAAQPIKGRITGKVIDSTTKAGVDFATVSLFKSGASNPFTGTSTDQQGVFSLADLPEGEYRLTADITGYRAKTIDHIVIGSKLPDVLLGNISLSNIWHSLKEVIVTAKTPVLENKIDKLVFNAAADLTSQSGVAADVLAKVPMVSVDIDGKVELQGNANVRFLINGKPANMYGSSITEALQTIPASQIKSIEVITSPGAKYNAAGTAGIINIVLKEDQTKGVNGNVNLSAGTRLENGALNLNAKTKNIGINAFFSGTDQLNSEIINTANRISYNQGMDTMTRFIQKRRSPFTRNDYESGLSLHLKISPKDELTLAGGFNHHATHATGNTAQDQLTYLSSGNVLSDIISQRVTSLNYGEDATNWSLAYKKTFSKEGRELNALYTSSYLKNFTNETQVTNYPDGSYPTSGINTKNPGNDCETDISLDYSEPVIKGFTMETGVKAVLETINNSIATDTLLINGNYINDNGQTYHYRFNRNIYAAYVSSSFTVFHDFLKGKAGIRFERTNTHSDLPGTTIPGDNIWAPDLLVQHMLNESSSLKFAYTYRIERPDYGDLNPFLDVIDPHNISTGNPLLKNETGHKFEFGYSKNFAQNSNLYVAAFYNYNDNDIQQFTTYYRVYTTNGTIYNDVSLAKSTNIGSQTTIGLNLSGSMAVSNHLSLRSNILLLDKNNQVPGLPSKGGFSYQVNFNADYQFNPNLIAEAFASFTSTRTDFQTVKPGSYLYTFAIKKQLLNKRASFGLTTTNPFYAYVNQYSSAYGTGFTQTNLRQKTLRSFGITLSYKFGKSK